MTYIPYQPPRPELADTILAFQAFAGPQVGAVIESDPLGPVNKIVTLMVGDRRIKSALCPVGVDSEVTVGRESGAWSLENLFAPLWWNNPGGSRPEIGVARPPGWFVEVDGRRIIEVDDDEIRPPAPKPPRPPWHRRARHALTSAVRRHVRADLDAITRRLGYHRDDECREDCW